MEIMLILFGLELWNYNRRITFKFTDYNYTNSSKFLWNCI